MLEDKPHFGAVQYKYCDAQIREKNPGVSGLLTEGSAAPSDQCGPPVPLAIAAERTLSSLACSDRALIWLFT